MNLEIIKKHKHLALVILLSFLGFLDAAYLTMLHFSGQIPPCSVTHGCERVLTSKFATVGPIPIAALGIGYFVVMMVFSLLYYQKKRTELMHTLFAFATIGFLVGLGLIYIQAQVLRAFCQYCVAAELIITLIFALTSWLYLKKSSH